MKNSFYCQWKDYLDWLDRQIGYYDTYYKDDDSDFAKGQLSALNAMRVYVKYDLIGNETK